MESKRLYVAIVLVPVIYFLVKHLPAWVFFVFATGGILTGMVEFYRMVFRNAARLDAVFGVTAGFVLSLIFYQPAWALVREWLTGLIVLTLLLELFTKKNLRDALMDGAVLLMGVFYVGWLLGHVILLRNMEEGVYLVFFIFLVTWSCDTGAYYTGRLIGRRPLSPGVSPKKTVEGAAGGLVWALAASLLARWWFLPQLSLSEAVGLGLFLGILAQLGDLTESMIKRSTGVKDSGGLLLAHGGILDRVDSLIFTAPAFYYFWFWVKSAGPTVRI
jgi:phosphatidate cytidylyltransferase